MTQQINIKIYNGLVGAVEFDLLEFLVDTPPYKCIWKPADWRVVVLEVN